MEAGSAALHTAVSAIQAIGRGFDVNFDTRLLYCKGLSGSRLIDINEDHTWDLRPYGGLIVPNVPRDIKSVQETGGRQSSGVFSYQEMVDYFNRRANVTSTLPLGGFNSSFSFTGSTNVDSVSVKNLSVDGFFIPTAKFQLVKTQLTLTDVVRRAVPSSWDPPALASFIESFGTHVITSVTIGGKDVIYVKQHPSSPLSAMEIKNYVQSIGNHRFSDVERNPNSSPGPAVLKDKNGDPHIFNSQGVYPQPTSLPWPSGKEDVTVIFRRRGGDDLEERHSRWSRTVWSSPDVIEMTFLPITSLLDGVTGQDRLAHAIDLYLQFKPPIEDLRWFLEFQIPRSWASSADARTAGRRKDPVCPSLQFSMMGQKLHVDIDQVSVGRRPVTGIRLRVDGPKQNRLTLQLQHLTQLPKILAPHWDCHVAIGAPRWHSPEEQDSRWFEPVKWKKFSHISTAPVENPADGFPGTLSAGVYVVTGAQLGVWDFGSRNVLYMKLLFSWLPGCAVRRSLWDRHPARPDPPPPRSDPPPVPPANPLLLRYVDTSDMCKGPADPPGHWLVTGAKLAVDKARIGLTLKYSLLNY